MSNVFLIAKKEYKDALRSGLFITIFLVLLLLSITSIIVASFLFQSQIADYHRSLQALRESGTTTNSPETQFYPLNLLRGVVDYLEIIGAILGIILGYYSVSKEKRQLTMQLILTRPIKRTEIIMGKILGNLLIIGSVVLLLTVIIVSALWFVGGTALSGSELVKLVLTMSIAVLYILLFFCLSAFLSLGMKNQSQSLMIALVIWLIVVLIIPQIGDTMDPDNQVPGGFFKSMNLTRAEEKDVLTHFSTYENTRDFIEQTSITKHFERVAFALLGVKNDYNGKSLQEIFADKWGDAVWVIVLLSVGVAGNYYLINKRDVLGGGST